MEMEGKRMLHTSVLKTFSLLIAVCVPLAAQAPSTETLALSLKTMSKALTGCREPYMLVQPGASAPLIKLVIGADSYDKDLMSLDRAKKLSDFLAANPSRVTGQGLVAILSTSDDFSVGVGSTQGDILRALILQNKNLTTEMANGLLPLSTSLSDCQKSLFNAGDDYVELVMRYVGSEDEALAALKPRPR